jgi:hypothetical protein
VRQAIVRDEPGVQEHESEQRAAARETDPLPNQLIPLNNIKQLSHPL